MCFNPLDAAKSLRGFERFVKPVLHHAVGARMILPTEKHNKTLDAALDQYAAIDGVFIDANGWMFSYSSRVQFVKCYETITIRDSRPSGARTEWHKILYAWQAWQARAKVQPMTPVYVIQAYVDPNEQGATVAIAETFEIVPYILNHPAQHRRTGNGGETFYYCFWRELATAQVYRVDADGQVVEVKKISR